jgi:hypothetical protein
LIVLLLPKADTDLHAWLRLDNQLAVNHLLLGVDTVLELDLGFFDYRLADNVYHVAQISRPKHVAVVGADRLVAVNLNEHEKHGERIGEKHNDFEAQPADSCPEELLLVWVCEAIGLVDLHQLLHRQIRLVDFSVPLEEQDK